MPGSLKTDQVMQLLFTLSGFNRAAPCGPMRLTALAELMNNLDSVQLQQRENKRRIMTSLNVMSCVVGFYLQHDNTCYRTTDVNSEHAHADLVKFCRKFKCRYLKKHLVLHSW